MLYQMDLVWYQIPNALFSLRYHWYQYQFVPAQPNNIGTNTKWSQKHLVPYQMVPEAFGTKWYKWYQTGLCGTKCFCGIWSIWYWYQWYRSKKGAFGIGTNGIGHRREHLVLVPMVSVTGESIWYGTKWPKSHLVLVPMV